MKHWLTACFNMSARGLRFAVAETADGAQVALSGTLQSCLRIAAYNKFWPCAIEPRIVIGLKFTYDVPYSCAIHGDQIRIAVHETDVPAIGAHLGHVAGHQRTASLFAGSPMQYLKSAEMAANADEREVVIQAMRLALPEHNYGIRILYPFAVGFVQIDGNAAECATPFDHTGIVMRMGNRNGRQSTERLHKLDGARINQTDAVPQNSAVLRLQQKRPLSNRELRFRLNSPNVLAFPEEDVTISFLQRFQSDPLLPAPSNVLALILANRARGRRIT